MSGMRGGKRFLGGLIVWVALAAAAPALAAAGSISGTVTAEGGGPLQGVEVCPTPTFAMEIPCGETGPDGAYALTGLPGGDYKIRFSGQRDNLRYVDEFYEDERYSFEADLFHLGETENRTLDAQLAEGGSISGTVSDETTGQPIAGIWACAIDSQGIPPRCSLSDADGDYVLNGIPSGVYSVEYEGGNRVNYLREFYEDAEAWAEATDVTVTAPVTTSGIDAELSPGGEIFGHVVDPRTGGPSRGVFVCANEVEPGEYQACDTTDPAGDYILRSLPTGSYLVAFGLEYFPWGMGADQWWKGAATAAEADPIVIAPPQTVTGIDGQATSPFWPQEPTGPSAGGGIVVPAAPSSQPIIDKRKLPNCKKGFRRKWVKGKRRCVRKHKPRKHRQRQQKGR
jgi:hypothetical protein